MKYYTPSNNACTPAVIKGVIEYTNWLRIYRWCKSTFSKNDPEMSIA